MSRALSRANSDLVMIDIISDDTSLDPIERMAAIAAYTRRYQRIVEYTPNNLPGDERARQAYPSAYSA